MFFFLVGPTPLLRGAMLYIDDNILSIPAAAIASYPPTLLRPLAAAGL